jgi:hypothetical protein
MNDHELIMVLREQRSKVPMTMPVEQIISRGRAVRARRRVPGVAAAVGTAAAVAVTVSVALPASHPAASHPASGHPAASHPASGPGVQLAAWTVTRQADGSIQVSFFGELRDPAKLQHTLRADGVPVSVTYIGQQNPACQPYDSSGSSSWPPQRPFTGPLADVLGGSRFAGKPKDAYNTQDAMVIHPSALPPDAGLQIAVMRGIPLGSSGPWPYPKGSGHPVVEVFLVKASPQCTGS